MNHKRRRHKTARAGCLMCKPNKRPGWPAHVELGHRGFGKLRAEQCARHDEREPS
jgi:hypothetical protein